MKGVLSIALVMLLSSTVIMGGDTTVDSTVSGAPAPIVQTLEVEEKEVIGLDETDYITWYGRVVHDQDGSVGFNYASSGFEVKVRATSLTMKFGTVNYADAGSRNYVTVIVDNDYASAKKFGIEMDDKELTIKLDGNLHTVKVLKNTEARPVQLSLKSLSVNGTFAGVDARPERFIEVYGDSITCGYGIIDTDHYGNFSTDTEDALKTYAFLTVKELGADWSVMSRSGAAIKQNDWGSSDTIPNFMVRTGMYNYTPYENPRIPQVVVINAGTNDTTYILNGNTTQPTKQEKEDAYVAAYIRFIEDIRERYDGVKIFICNGMLRAESEMKPALERVIEGAGGDDITYVSLPWMLNYDIGADGHPGANTHAAAATVLTNAIKNKMGW